MSIFIYEKTILEHHLDSFGHVNNAKYLELFEECRWEMITLGGYGHDKVQALQIGPVVLEANVKFKKELHLREKIKIDFQINLPRGKLMSATQQIFNEKNEVAAIGEFLFGLFDLKERKLITPTAEWLKIFSLPSN